MGRDEHWRTYEFDCKPCTHSYDFMKGYMKLYFPPIRTRIQMRGQFFLKREYSYT